MGVIFEAVYYIQWVSLLSQFSELINWTGHAMSAGKCGSVFY